MTDDSDRSVLDGTARNSLLEQTLSAAVRDVQTVTPDGRSSPAMIHDVSFHEVVTHADERGSVVEMFDARWNWHPDPVNSAYCFTLRPGYVKGWNLHKTHDDRYFLLQGEMELVLYDVRPESPTCGHISRIVLTAHNRRIVNIPKFVWHADRNIGQGDVVVVNFPTRAYEHTNPDKYRLPINTPLIPYTFPDARGW